MCLIKSEHYYCQFYQTVLNLYGLRIPIHPDDSYRFWYHTDMPLRIYTDKGYMANWHQYWCGQSLPIILILIQVWFMWFIPIFYQIRVISLYQYWYRYQQHWYQYCYRGEYLYLYRYWYHIITAYWYQYWYGVLVWVEVSKFIQQWYQTRSTKSSLANKISQTRSIRRNLANKIYQTNLLSQFY